MNIFEYLCREAYKVTNASLSDLKDKDYWIRTRDERRAKFIEMLGLSDYLNDSQKRKFLNFEIMGVIECEGYRIEKLWLETLPGLYVTANLYVPSAKGKKPAILYLCGHAKNQKYHYQFHCHKYAQLGFVTLLIETIQKGEIHGHHHGTYHLGMWNWYSLGYTPAGVEVWNAIKALDFLCNRPEVDQGKIGVTGISGGGAMSWFVAAVDDRIKVVAPVCATATIASHICKRTLEGHCDCMFWINNYLWDLTDVGALIAPRPLLIASAIRDWIFDIESVRIIYHKLRKLYELFGKPENILLVETPGGHAYHEKSRCMIYKWFLKHLMGKDVSYDELLKFDKEPVKIISSDELKIFTKGIPENEKVSTVHEWFIRVAEPPKIDNAEDLDRYRKRLIKILYEKTFYAFPRKETDLNVKIELVRENANWLGYLVSYTSEEDVRLHMSILRPKNVSGKVPIVVFITRNARNLYFGDELVRGLSNNIARAYVEVRGIGETSWSPDLQWFIRRACMLIGRTIASIRVYDLLRALKVLENFDWIDRNKIALMGCDEMAVIAIYTALLRGNIATVILHNPPPSHNILSDPEGKTLVIELLNVLRYTDLPYVTGLLWPTEIVFIDQMPESYKWVVELYCKLNTSDKIKVLESLSSWTFN